MSKTILSIVFIMGLLMIPFHVIPYADAAEGDLLLTINNPTPAPQDNFGSAVAVTPDGNLVIGAKDDDTGAFEAGSVYLYGIDGILLLTINNPTPARQDYFGSAVAVTPDGNLVIGAEGDDENPGNVEAGTVYLYGTDGTLLLTINNPTPETADTFGNSVASTSEGNILIGAPLDNTGADDAGSAYLYGINGTLLLTLNDPTPSQPDYFGVSLAVTPDDNLVIGVAGDDTGAYSAGSVYLYGIDGTLLLTINNPTPETQDAFGNVVASTSEGNILIGAPLDNTGATSAGSAYLFDGTDGSLLLTINNPTPENNDQFGNAVAVTPNDNILIGAAFDNTGATGTGSAYLFNGTDGTLLLTINNPTPEQYDLFGELLAVTPNGNIVVGAARDDTGATDAGSVYLFEGIDPLYCGHPESSYNIIRGTDNRDFLIGTPANDLIFGYDGNDYIRGGNGNDCIFGGDGHDLIQGGADNDELHGEAGDDVMRTGPGFDFLYGEEGNDVLRVSFTGDSNVLNGGDGNYDVCVPSGPGMNYITIDCEFTE